MYCGMSILKGIILRNSKYDKTKENFWGGFFFFFFWAVILSTLGQNGTLPAFVKCVNPSFFWGGGRNFICPWSNGTLPTFVK
jgi:hypothetical protein